MLGMSEGRGGYKQKGRNPSNSWFLQSLPLLIKWEEGSGVRSPVDSIGVKENLSSPCDSYEKYDSQNLLEG